MDQYVHVRTLLERHAVANHENVWNGRPISLIVPAEPLEVLDDEATARPQGADHVGERELTVRQVGEDQAGVHEVEGTRRRCIRHHVVLEHLEATVRGEPPHVDVRGDDAIVADSRCQPRRHGRTTCADLPAAPALVHTNGIEVAEEKKRVALLSRPYFTAAERLTVRKGDAKAPRSLEQLKGRTVGTLPGSLAERIAANAGAEVKTYEGGQDEIYEDLKLGRTDAVLLDAPVSLYYGFDEVFEPSEPCSGAPPNVQFSGGTQCRITVRCNCVLDRIRLPIVKIQKAEQKIDRFVVRALYSPANTNHSTGTACFCKPAAFLLETVGWRAAQEE